MRSGLYVMKKRGSSGGWQHNLAGISPLPAKAALPNACDAFNARTIGIGLIQEGNEVVFHRRFHFGIEAALPVERLQLVTNCTLSAGI